MANIGEVIQIIQSLYSKGVQSKDSRLSPRQIYSAIISARATILKQRINKNQQISNWNYQLLPCVELIKAPVHECFSIPKGRNDGCVILRTKIKLPSPLSGIDGDLIQSVTSLDGMLVFDKGELKYSDGNKFTANKARYYLKNQYAYFPTYNELKGVAIEGLFDDPIEAYYYPSTCGLCDTCKAVTDIEFPADRDTLKAITEVAAEQLLMIFIQMKEDKTSNASDDEVNEGQMIHK